MNAVSPLNEITAGSALAYLPIFLGVKARKVLLIGGGESALAKLALLRRAGANVHIVWPNLCPLLSCRVAEDPQIHHTADWPRAVHFEDAVLVFDASDDMDVAQRTVRLARSAGLPVNVVDRPALCDFIMPAILDRSPIVVAVSTGGLAPGIARLIRQRLETALPTGIAQLAALAAQFRNTVARHLGSARQRAHFWESLFDGDIARLVADGRVDDAHTSAEALMEELRATEETAPLHVLSIDTDDPELLTVRAARLIRMAEVILHDSTVEPGILELGRREALRLAVDPRQKPADMLRKHAVEGRFCVYLKSGTLQDGKTWCDRCSTQPIPA